MNDTWDLSILYKGFDDPAFTGNMAASGRGHPEHERPGGPGCRPAPRRPGAPLCGQQLQLTTLISKLFIFCSLRISANTADNQANILSDQISAKISGCAAADASLRHTLAAFDDLDAIIDADPALAEYRYLLRNIRRDSKYLLSDKEEELFARMNISGASAWESLR